MILQLLYFARLKDAFGVSRESFDSNAASVTGLLEQLRARGDVWREELDASRVFRVAVNQTLATGDTPLKEGDEVAIFPPVTGG